MSLLALEDTGKDILIKMSKGVPGAAIVLATLLKCNSIVDPDSGIGEFGTILMLDDMEVYGSDIWLLYKDICGENIVNLVGVVRAMQLGFISKEQIKAAIASRRTAAPIDLPVGELLKQVKARLAAFNLEYRPD